MSKIKAVDIIWNGKPLKKIYPHATRWQVFKYKMGQAIRKILIFILRLVLWVGIIALGIWVIHTHWPKVEVQVIEKEVVIDNLSNKIEEMKGEIISDIKKGESLGAAESAGLIVYDPPKNIRCKSDVVSLGNYQFKVCTVQYYYKKLYGKEITQKEAILIALDDNLAASLTSDIVFSEKEGWRNWYNTAQKYDIPERLELLAKLQK